VALHPGTVATVLSAPFLGELNEVSRPEAAAVHLLAVIDGLAGRGRTVVSAAG